MSDLLTLTDAAFDNLVINMTSKERASALRQMVRQVRELQEALGQVDLGEWEDDRLREWLPAAAESEMVKRLTARSEGLNWELGMATRRMAELEAENVRLRERLAAAEERGSEFEEGLAYVETNSDSLAPPVGYKPDPIQFQCLRTWYSAGEVSIHHSEQVLHAVLGLTGEAGEVADLVKKWAFKPGASVGREDVLDELADVLYYTAVLAHLWEFDNEDMLDHLAKKLADGHGWKGLPPIVAMRCGEGR